MIIFGLLLGMIGTDVNSGAAHFHLRPARTLDGIGFVIVAMGLFGVGEIIDNLEHESTRSVMVKSVTGLMPTWEDFKRMIGPVLRDFALGSALGILPGGGAALASFGAYALEKKVSRNRAQFGKGAIEGVAAPDRPTTPEPR